MNLESGCEDYFHQPTNKALAFLTHTHSFLFAHKHGCTNEGGALHPFSYFAILQSTAAFKALQENYNTITKSERAPGQAPKWAL